MDGRCQTDYLPGFAVRKKVHLSCVTVPPTPAFCSRCVVHTLHMACFHHGALVALAWIVTITKLTSSVILLESKLTMHTTHDERTFLITF